VHRKRASAGVNRPDSGGHRIRARCGEFAWYDVLPICRVSFLSFVLISRCPLLAPKSGLRYDKRVETLPNGELIDNRVQHLLYHGSDDPARFVGSATKPKPHGVFDAGQEGVLDVVDEAWRRAQSQGLQPVNGAYTVPMGRRIGYEGGVVGAQTGRQACDSVLLVVRNEVVEGGTRVADVITAYPVR